MTGLASHASYPQEGKNAFRCFSRSSPHFSPGITLPMLFLRTMADRLRLETNGESFSIGCSDETSGALTINPAVLSFSDEELILKFDIRYPVTSDSDLLLQKLQEQAERAGASYELIQHKPPLYVEKDRPFIRKMQESYTDFTGEEARLISIGGGTYCRYVPNTVSYGPVFPGQKEMAHQADEFISLEDLRKIAKDLCPDHLQPDFLTANFPIRSFSPCLCGLKKRAQKSFLIFVPLFFTYRTTISQERLIYLSR